MKFNADHYYQAGLERMKQSRLLYDAEGGENYAIAMYLAGLAVECILRAFRWKRDPSFEERHDLAELFKASGLLQVDEAHMQEKGCSPEKAQQYIDEMREAMNTVVVLWANNYRFASEARLRTRLNEMGLYKGIKGEVLKVLARRLLNAAQRIVDKGVTLWTSGKK